MNRIQIQFVENSFNLLHKISLSLKRHVSLSRLGNLPNHGPKIARVNRRQPKVQL